MNAYDVKAGKVFFAGQKLCDPCLSTFRWFVYHTRCYTSALILPSPLPRNGTVSDACIAVCVLVECAGVNIKNTAR